MTPPPPPPASVVLPLPGAPAIDARPVRARRLPRLPTLSLPRRSPRLQSPGGAVSVAFSPPSPVSSALLLPAFVSTPNSVVLGNPHRRTVWSLQDFLSTNHRLRSILSHHSFAAPPHPKSFVSPPSGSVLAYPPRPQLVPSLSLSCFVHNLCLHAQSSRSFPFMSPHSAGALPSPPLAQLLGPVSPLPPGSVGVPVLNVDAAGQPLTYRSALTGPFRQQWLASDDDELVKLVRGTRTLTPIHTYTSTPTYYNRVVKEKWTQSVFSPPAWSVSISHLRCLSACSWHRGR
jgi:hypothetical protein